MPATIVTRESVFLAAATLDAQGQNPTQKRVREQLGGGSYEQISPYLREWKSENKMGNGTAVRHLEEMPAAVFSQFQAIWSAAVLAADNHIILERQEQLEQDVERLQEELQVCHTARHELEAVQANMHPLVERLEQLADQNNELRRENVELKEKLKKVCAESVYACGQVKLAEIRVEELEIERDRVIEQNQQLVQKVNELESQALTVCNHQQVAVAGGQAPSADQQGAVSDEEAVVITQGAESSSGLTGVALVKRLNTKESTLRGRKHKPDFTEWSRQLDPQGIGWEYNAEIKLFYPLPEPSLNYLSEYS